VCIKIGTGFLSLEKQHLEAGVGTHCPVIPARVILVEKGAAVEDIVAALEKL
jgi:hypothetical protein